MSTSGRVFLFLQGPPGPFFFELAAALTQQGHRCLRLNLNGGDRLDWKGKAINFAGQAADWPLELARILEANAVTDLLLFGDCRPWHRAACEVAVVLHVEVHVFEEGYIRPDWITWERGGVNGYSRLARDPATYLQSAAGLAPLPAYAPVPSSMWTRSRQAFAYYALVWLLSPLYPGYRSHRPVPILSELGGWARKLVSSPLRRVRSRVAKTILGRQKYFILPLQLESDYQIRVHSPFAGMRDAIEAVIASFAAHAPCTVVLVVKEHPLDNGLIPWRQIVAQIASAHGVGQRVYYFSHGHIDQMVRGAIGVVTVNSTTGTLALSAGIPVAVLGDAVYNLAGITHQGPLDTFWQRPTRPQMEIYDAFYRVLAATCLVRGGYSSAQGRALLLPTLVARLTDAPQEAETGRRVARQRTW